MMRIQQKMIARVLGVSPSFLCEILKGKGRLSASSAKRIADEHNIDCLILLFGTPEQIRAEICKKLSKTIYEKLANTVGAGGRD